MSSALKLRISSPLEAGRSILDSHSLPAHLAEALEYTSRRLARKALHVTLVVIRKDYQLPPSSSSPSSSSSSGLAVPPTPTSPPPPFSAGAAGASADPVPAPTALSSPLLKFSAASPIAGLRSLVRRGTGHSAPSSSTAAVAQIITSPLPSATTSPAFPPYASPSATGPGGGGGGGGGDLPSPRRWPPTPGSSVPCTPRTPHTPASMMTSMSSAISSAMTTNGPNNNVNTNSSNSDHFGMRLIYTTPLSPKDDKTVRAAIEKAEKKFRLVGTGWLLPPAASAAACGLNADLVRRSMVQNEVLFSSEGLTLLGLDRLYTFKSALASYARVAAMAAGSEKVMLAQTRIEDAVDELRRLVLANNNSGANSGASGLGSPGRPRQISRAHLYRSYDWIRVSPNALADVERMYKRAYGGPLQFGAFETSPAEEEQEREIAIRNDMVKIGTPPPGRATPLGRTTPSLKINTANLSRPSSPRLVRPKTVGTPPPAAVSPHQQVQHRATSPVHPIVEQPQLSPRRQNDRTPKLTLQTAPSAIEIKIEKAETLCTDESECEDEESEHGDRTARPFHGMPFWSNIDELLSPVEGNGEKRKSEKLGPMTPNGYDDISPITRGEWGFLFAQDGTWKENRTAAVETW